MHNYNYGFERENERCYIFLERRILIMRRSKWTKVILLAGILNLANFPVSDHETRIILTIHNRGYWNYAVPLRTHWFSINVLIEGNDELSFRPKSTVFVFILLRISKELFEWKTVRYLYHLLYSPLAFVRLVYSATFQLMFSRLLMNFQTLPDLWKTKNFYWLSKSPTVTQIGLSFHKHSFEFLFHEN